MHACMYVRSDCTVATGATHRHAHVAFESVAFHALPLNPQHGETSVAAITLKVVQEMRYHACGDDPPHVFYLAACMHVSALWIFESIVFFS